jgi:hypothetical protein
MIKSRRMRWARHVAHVGARRGAYRLLIRRPEGKNHLTDPGKDGRIILKLIFRKWGGEACSELILLSKGTDGRCL